MATYGPGIDQSQHAKSVSHNNKISYLSSPISRLPIFRIQLITRLISIITLRGSECQVLSHQALLQQGRALVVGKQVRSDGSGGQVHLGRSWCPVETGTVVFELDLLTSDAQGLCFLHSKLMVIEYHKFLKFYFLWFSVLRFLAVYKK